jgi:hypothetical protein
MFRASPRPSSGATTTAVAAFGLQQDAATSQVMRICCILLVDSVENMMLHGFANPNFLLIFKIFCEPYPLPSILTAVVLGSFNYEDTKIQKKLYMYSVSFVN